MAVPLSLPRLPPLWREGRFPFEAAALLRDPVFHGQAVWPGDGRAVLLIPGFLAGDGSLATMTMWLRRAGYRTHRAGIRANVGCSEAGCLRLEERLEQMSERTGQRVSIIGQSRGGVFARAVAARRPDLVSGIVTLGSPVVSQLAVHPMVLAQVGVVAALGTLRVPGLLTAGCLRGPCCAPFRAAMAGPFPSGVGYLAVYSRSDGIVDWRSCLDPAAEHLEAGASHCGMSLNGSVYRGTADALHRFAEAEGEAFEFAEAA